MDYRQRITIEPGKRGGKPCIRGMQRSMTPSACIQLMAAMVTLMFTRRVVLL